MVAAAVVLVVRSSFADHYVVPTGSMDPTVQVGDRVVVDKEAYGIRFPLSEWWLTGPSLPERGQIVVFTSPDDGEVLLKRVVAVAGDRVAVREGRVLLGADADSAPNARYEGEHDAMARHGPDYGPMTVPAGHLLLLGDNRGNSHDSRYFGPVPATALRGRVRGIYARAGALGWRPVP